MVCHIGQRILGCSNHHDHLVGILRTLGKFDICAKHDFKDE